jgi:transcriptional regulator with XRE-family HTH domain
MEAEPTDMNRPTRLGRFFQTMRRERDLSQRDVGEGVGLNQRELSLIENGKRHISRKLIYRFVTYFISSNKRFSDVEWAGMVNAYLGDFFEQIPNGQLEVVQKSGYSRSNMPDILFHTPWGSSLLIGIAAGENVEQTYFREQNLLLKALRSDCLHILERILDSPVLLETVRKAVGLDSDELKLLSLYLDQLAVRKQKGVTPRNDRG